MQTQRRYKLLRKVRQGESLLGIASVDDIQELEPLLWRRTDPGPPARYALNPDGQAEYIRLRAIQKQEAAWQIQRRSQY
jgi:hypothetical protein